MTSSSIDSAFARRGPAISYRVYLPPVESTSVRPSRLLTAVREATVSMR